MSFYLGLDSSTQSLSAMVVDTDTGRVVLDLSVNYERDLPAFPGKAGVLENPNPLVKHSDPCIWVAALDLLLSRGREAGFDWGTVAAVSGSGQQHGSVYFGVDPASIGDWDVGRPLAAQLLPLLSRPTAPIWMDSSTALECQEITDFVGDAADVVRITGSRAIERFTGPQIRKFYREAADAYAATRRIHLVSSFMAAVLCADDVGIDYGDGAGMNLLDLSTGTWNERMLAATAPGLAAKLPPAIPSTTRVGTICRYFVSTYGFRPGTPVIAFSGDNPNSLVGMGAAAPGGAVVSLGTSDTCFAALPQPCTDPRGYGHVFGNPAGGFMSLICFKNGSLAREAVAERFAMSWDDFTNAILEQSRPGNDGNMLLPYFVPEITPRILDAKPKLFGSDAFMAWQEPAAAARGVVEAQALSMFRYSDWIGERPDELLVTGGGSQNRGILQIFADVFDARIKRLPLANSAALGAAMRAAMADGQPLSELNRMFAAPDDEYTVDPDPAAVVVYRDLVGIHADRVAEAFGV